LAPARPRRLWPRRQEGLTIIADLPHVRYDLNPVRAPQTATFLRGRQREAVERFACPRWAFDSQCRA
jgi:hypothetical protein